MTRANMDSSSHRKYKITNENYIDDRNYFKTFQLQVS